MKSVFLSVATPRRTALFAALAAAGLAGGAAWSQALPTGGQISLGRGSIASAGTELTVTQDSARLAADWQSFSIGAGHTVRFVQPSASAIALNRVTGPNPSTIQGALQANGQVFLLNPNGVLFSPTAQVNVGGLVASTLNLSNEDFAAGRLRFEGSSTRAITQQGRISAGPGGSVALIAARIVNEGRIEAPGGSVLVGAGSAVTLDLGGPAKLQVERTALDAEIVNGGAILAGNQVLLTARAANALSAGVINNRGLVEATGLGTDARGHIVLQAGEIAQQGTLAAAGGQVTLLAPRSTYLSGLVDVSRPDGQAGRIDVATGRFAGMASGELRADGSTGGAVRIESTGLAAFSSRLSARGRDQGGRIEVTGESLALLNAEVDASSQFGRGGTVHLGGGWQGSGDLRHASHTLIGMGSRIRASGGSSGGEIVLWSTDSTEHYGSAEARGGRIELSSKGRVALMGALDAGAGGLVLLDPKNLVITDTPPDGITLARRLAYGALGGSSTASDAFGSAIALDGDLLAVGVHRGETGGTNRGEVSLFSGVGSDFSGLTWRGVLGSGTGAAGMPALADGAEFGVAVALDAGRLAVGANLDPAGGAGRGAVYLFNGVGTDFTGLNFRAKLSSGSGAAGMPALADNDNFGRAVALDGDRLAVGAHLDDTGGSNSGAVHLFTGAGSDFSGLTWQKKLYSGQGATGMPGVGAVSNLGTGLALQGDLLAVGSPRQGTGAIHLFTGVGTDFSGLAWRKTVTSSAGAVGMPALASNANFGASLTLDGDLLAAGAYNDDASVNLKGAVFMFSGVGTNFSGLAYRGKISSGAGAAGMTTIADGDRFGLGVSLDGDRLAVGTGGSSFIYLFTGMDNLRQDLAANGYGDNPAGTSYVSANSVAGLLGTGSALTLQASNDITVASAIIVNNTSGNGGALTLQAGRSVLLNAGIATDNGNLTIIANDRATSGVVDAQRDAGAALVTMANGTTINAGSGTVDIQLRDGAGNTNNTAGAITLAGVQAASLAIDSVNLGGSIAAANKTYDGNANAVVTATLNGLAFTASSNLSAVATGSFADKHAGATRTVTSGPLRVTGFAGAASSNLKNGGADLQATATADVAQRALTVTASGQDKVYDGNAGATVAYGDNRVTGDTLTVTGSASFGDKNVGNGKAVGVSGIGLGGADAGNYSFNTTASTAANITPRALTVTANGQDKVYDGNANATVSYGDNRVTGDTLTVTGNASFGDKNAGNGKAVAVTGIVLGNTDAGNYSFNTSAATTASITQRALAITATGQNKVYDGNTAATVSYGDDRVGGDALAITGTATFGDRNAGAGKAVSASGIAVTGADAGNYTFNTTATTAADITVRPLNLAGSRVENGTKVFGAGDLAASNVVAGDTVTLGGSATVASALAGLYPTFTANNLSSSNSNYGTGGGTVAATIVAAPPQAAPPAPAPAAAPATEATGIAGVLGAVIADIQRGRSEPSDPPRPFLLDVRDGGIRLPAEAQGQ